jgi:hypothetical protein
VESSVEHLRAFARAFLDLRLDEADAAACHRALSGLRESVRHLDRVPLPFNAGVFIEPAHGAQWLEEWEDAR